MFKAKKTPLEEFKKGITKSDVTRLRKVLKSSFDVTLLRPCSEWDIKYSIREPLSAIHFVCAKGNKQVNPKHFLNNIDVTSSTW